MTARFLAQLLTILVLPATFRASVMLAPKAEVSLFPWKEPKERIPLAVRQIRSFLRAHQPALTTASMK